MTKHDDLKPLLSICLCLCLFAPFLGTWSWIKIDKHRVRKEVKRNILAGIEKDALVHLQFTKAETQSKLNWRHAGEFEFEGQMYDIVKTTERADSLFYWCWQDNAETALNQQVQNLIKQSTEKDPQNQENQNRLTDFLKTLCYRNSEGLLPLPHIHTLKPNVKCTKHDVHLCTPPPSPPPEIV